MNLMLAAVVLAAITALNFRESRTESKPYYAPMLGARWHPPPYDMQELNICVSYEIGWPIWHARHTDVFAAHNAALYREQDRRKQDQLLELDFDSLEFFDLRQSGPLNYVLNWYRASFNAFFAVATVVLTVIASEAIQWRSSQLRKRITKAGTKTVD